MPQFRIVDDEAESGALAKEHAEAEAKSEPPAAAEMQPDISIEWIRSLVRDDNSTPKLHTVIITPLFGLN